ncbi:MAG: LysE family translocator [Sphingomonadales bacterium]|nr:LysE family translocator [Sphingomonadales bacterium]
MIISEQPVSPGLASFLLTALLVELTPGPNMAWLALLTASNGRYAGLAATLGVATGLLIIGFAAVLGFSQFIQEYPALYNILQYGGVVFLLYLAWDAWPKQSSDNMITDSGAGAATYFKRGLLINLLNPKAMLFFVLVIPAFISANHAARPQSILLVFIYTAVATAVHLMIILLSGQAHALLSRKEYRTNSSRVFAALLLLTALWMFWKVMI